MHPTSPDKLENLKTQDPKLPKINYEELSPAEILSFEQLPRIPGKSRKALILKYFSEIEQCRDILRKHCLPLKTIFLAELANRLNTKEELYHWRKSTTEKNRNNEIFLIRDLSIEIDKNPEKVRKSPLFSNRIKDEIINTANRYLSYRSAILKISDTLIQLYFNSHPSLLHQKHYGADDLIQMARVGLIHAVDNFVTESGYYFVTYTITCIRHAIFNEILSNNNIFHYSYDTASRITKLKTQLNQQQNATGTTDIEESSKALGIKPETAKQLLIASEPPASILESSWIRDTIPSPQQLAIAEEAQERKTHFAKSVLPILMKALTNRERTVLIEHYGLFSDNPPKTYNEIAAILSPRKPLSRQRIEQIERSAKKKLLKMMQFDKELFSDIDDLFFH